MAVRLVTCSRTITAVANPVSILLILEESHDDHLDHPHRLRGRPHRRGGEAGQRQAGFYLDHLAGHWRFLAATLADSSWASTSQADSRFIGAVVGAIILLVIYLWSARTKDAYETLLGGVLACCCRRVQS